MAPLTAMRSPPLIVRALQACGMVVIGIHMSKSTVVGAIMLSALWFLVVEVAWDTRPRW